MRMQAYIVTATGTDGRRETFARDSVSVEHLRLTLERDGFRDIEFHDDDMSAALRAGRPEAGRPLTKRDYRLELRSRREPTGALLWKQALRANLWMLAIAGLLVAYGVWRGSVWAIVIPLVVVALWGWMVAKGVRQANLYNELLVASAHGHLPRMRSLIAAMRATPAARDNAQLQADLLFREAAVLARGGDIDSALKLVQPLRDAETCAHGIFESRCGGLHAMAGQQDAFLTSIERACERGGNGPTHKLDLAFAHARVGDPERAQSLLEQVEQRNLTDLHSAIFDATRGVIDFRRGHWETAVPTLEGAARSLATYEANPAVWPFNALVAAYLALALARCSRPEQATAALAPWRQIADATVDADLRGSIESEIPH
jgi:tetratricopeptide (TPR) repeat protein